MGLNFGAVFAGAAKTISERVKEQEQRVNLLTDKALDLGTQVYLDKKKDAERDAKLLEQGMASLAMTGLDSATRFRIAQGGSTAVNNTLNQYNSFLEKDSEGDFSTFYSVKGSDAFADMSDSEFLSMYGPRAEYDPSVARKYLAGRGADSGIGGLFVSDPTEMLSEFEAKAGVLGESRVTDAPELGTLSIDMTAMQKVFGKEAKELRFDTPKEGITYYTQAILNEKEREGGGDADIISGYEGRINAFKAIDAKDDAFSLDGRLDEIANEIYKLEQDDATGNAAAITKLEGERDGYLEHKASVSATGRAPDSKTQTLDNVLDSVQIALEEAITANKPQSEIDALKARETVLLERKHSRAKDTGTNVTDAFTAPQAATNVRNRVNLTLGSFDFVEVDTLTGRMDVKFGDGSDNYPTFFSALESVDAGIVRDSGVDGYNSKNLKLARGYVTDLLSTNVDIYMNKYKEASAHPTLNKSFPSLEDAKAAARNGSIDVGTIVRYTQNGRTGIMVYTGGAVDDGFR